MKLCSIDGCERVTSARGLCSRHYNQQRLGKPFTFKASPVCSVRDCDRPAYSKGRCNKHWRTQRALLGEKG